MTYKIKNICCIGAGYVGGPTMSVMADKCPNVQFEVVDLNRERIDRWNDSDLQMLPIYEPGLAEIVNRCRGKNLHFSTFVEEKIKSADMIFISVNTPTKKRGIGAGKASDLKWVEACARQVAKYSEGYTIVVEKSTLPVRTAEVIKSILHNEDLLENKSPKFDILSNPEFLSEGSAIKDLMEPDRVLIGGEREEAIESLCEIYRNWIPKNKILKNATIGYSKHKKESLIETYYINDPKTFVGKSLNIETALKNRLWKDSLSQNQKEFILKMFTVPNKIPITSHLMGKTEFDKDYCLSN